MSKWKFILKSLSIIGFGTKNISSHFEMKEQIPLHETEMVLESFLSETFDYKLSFNPLLFIESSTFFVEFSVIFESTLSTCFLFFFQKLFRLINWSKWSIIEASFDQDWRKFDWFFSLFNLLFQFHEMCCSFFILLDIPMNQIDI